MLPRKKVIELSFEETNNNNLNKINTSVEVKEHAINSIDATIEALNTYCERLCIHY